MRLSHFISLLVAVCCGQAGALDLTNLDETTPYPSKAPYETEADIPPHWRASTPSFTFDDADVGGYVHTFAEKLQMMGGTITMDHCPYCPCANGFYMYLYVAVFEIPPMDVPEDWNCTLIGFIWSSSDFTGLVAGERICDVGSCCDAIIGLPKYSDDVADYEDWLNNRVTGSMCDKPHHDMYCIWVGGDFWVNCQEYTPSPTDRHYIVPCYDGHFLFNLNCKVFTVEYVMNYRKEPPIYYASLTNIELMSNDAFQMIQDSVCRPNRYYVPSAATSADQVAGLNGSDDASDDASSDDASSSLTVSVAAIFVIISLLS